MRADLGDCAAIAGLKLAVCALVLASGFHAVSDDDFARVVIAQQWVTNPALDPSGTSWLPFPFWLNGVAMALLGRSFAVARAVAIATAVASAWLVYATARSLDVPRPGAIVGAVVACGIPYASWLGVATVPDGLTAALILFGASTMRHDSTRRRAAGAAALFAATLSRYEAWPVAVVFAAYSAWDGYRKRARDTSVVSAVALLGPVTWMLHGLVHHSDPLFFVARVRNYRSALGGSTQSAAMELLGYPISLVRSEPELTAVLVGTAAIALAARHRFDAARYSRLGVALGALLAFLIVGEARGAAPTHHAERALLAIWLAEAVLAGDLLGSAWPELTRGARVLGGTVLVGLVAVAVSVVRPRWVEREGFVDRRAELAIGHACSVVARASDRLAIDTTDYGFFAVMAGFRHPERAAPLDDHDPRRPHATDPFRSPTTLSERLQQEGATWLVTHEEHRPVAMRVAHLEAQRRELVLLRVGIQ